MTRAAVRVLGLFCLALCLFGPLGSCRQLVEPSPVEREFWNWPVQVVDMEGTPLPDVRIHLTTLSEDDDTFDYDADFRADAFGRVVLQFPGTVRLQFELRPDGNLPIYVALLPNPAESEPRLVYALRPLTKQIAMDPFLPQELDGGSLALRLVREIEPGRSRPTWQNVDVDPDGSVVVWATDDMRIEVMDLRLEWGTRAFSFRNLHRMEFIKDVEISIPAAEAALVNVRALHPDLPALPGEIRVWGEDFVAVATEADLRSSTVELYAPPGPVRLELWSSAASWQYVIPHIFRPYWRGGESFEYEYAAHRVDLSVLDHLALPVAGARVSVNIPEAGGYTVVVRDDGTAPLFLDPGDYLFFARRDYSSAEHASVPMTVTADDSVVLQLSAPDAAALRDPPPPPASRSRRP